MCGSFSMTEQPNGNRMTITGSKKGKWNYLLALPSTA